ncbi:DUF2634 domain-containing protein [Paenibacillus pinihumi]|uniref:DUF2634 domain-containing protein n=1 Tax=Paenibacillus pinihumi TaxID=669462 RepID=UPI00048AE36E|nr:DUF2634 domain-containing protein [Paenibacillus pinihumi]
MLPNGAITSSSIVFDQSEQPSRTYKLDMASHRISGVIDNLDAVQQAVYKVLQTERFVHLIYTNNYGCEIKVNAVDTEIERWINEALLQDERIQAIEDLRVQREGESALVEFTVVSTAGHFSVLQEVN